MKVYVIFISVLSCILNDLLNYLLHNFYRYILKTSQYSYMSISLIVLSLSALFPYVSEAILLDAYMFRIIAASWIIDPFIIM